MDQSQSKKRLQVVFSDEAWATVMALTKEANENFEVGSITYSDVVNELVICGKIDLKTLQLKKTDIKKSLRLMASQDQVDLDSVIKTLSELRAKPSRKTQKPSEPKEDSKNG